MYSSFLSSYKSHWHEICNALVLTIFKKLIANMISEDVDTETRQQNQPALST